MTRPSERTRDKILTAAVRLFAERGYDGASIRAIVAKARVNQAAITYHFDGKDGLYREVLRIAFAAMTQDETINAETMAAMPREEALRRFVRRQLRPLVTHDDISRYLQIFNWESVRPSAVFKAFLAEEAAPLMALASDLVRRFLPANAGADKVTLAALWLFGQCSVFVRNREQLGSPDSPLHIRLDAEVVDNLADTICRWAIGGLAQSG
jgi:AcrR family transcriptional regulator